MHTLQIAQSTRLLTTPNKHRTSQYASETARPAQSMLVRTSSTEIVRVFMAPRPVTIPMQSLSTYSLFSERVFNVLFWHNVISRLWHRASS